LITTSARALFLAWALALAACQPAAPKFKSTDITGADYGKSLQLAAHDGKPRTFASFAGKVVVVTFGFTHCPDVCPTILADLAGVLKKLGPDADRVQVLFISVDPERDSAEGLAKYVTAFDPRFIGLRGDAEATQRTAKEFKVFFEKRKVGDSYTVDHSAQSYVFDPKGRLRLFVRHDRISADLADDLKTLLKEG
jgi:protein SCO1/2